MKKDTYFDFKSKGFKLVGRRITFDCDTYIFDYTNQRITLTEFSILLSEHFGSDIFEFKPIEVSNSKNKYYEITFFFK